jgi:hypothetical protein
MSISDHKLTLSGNAELLNRLSKDFYDISLAGDVQIPIKRMYIIECEEEPTSVKRSARKAMLMKIAESKQIRKIAIDTRNIDQEEQRNPRKSLQYWHRSDPFIDEDMQRKINIFAKINSALENIKEEYGKEAEYHDSYARVLTDHVSRTLRLKQGDNDIFAPQMSYLEQLLFARYRLSMEEIDRMSVLDIKTAILKKDEDLMKRGVYLGNTGGISKNSGGPLVISGDSSKSTQQNIVEAIFGNQNLLRSGDKKVQRTITITLTDAVIED